MTIDLSSLNDSQRTAASWNEGPLLVLAGPGAGKTRVLTYRIARLLDSSPGQRFKVLGLTFTNKAAAEMRDRIASLVPDAEGRTLLTTFHSFCADVLRQHGSHIGVRPDFTIMSQEVEREQLLDEVLDGLRDQFPDLNLRGERLLPLVSRMLDHCVPADEAERVLREQKLSEPEALAAAYRGYRERMLSEQALDFSALIAECRRLLERMPAVKKQIHRIYQHVCVDEFQDTNLAQYEVLKQVVSSQSPNLFVVADGDQMIYQWNGASPERLEQLRADFGCSELQLPENYRCPAEVIESANRLIACNLNRSGIPQRPSEELPASPDAVRLKALRTFDDELVWVAQDIAARDVAERSRCAVLSRTRKPLQRLVEALEAVGVAAYLPIRKNEFQSPPLAFLHSILRLTNARQDREQLRRLCKAFYSLEGVRLNVRDVVSRASTQEGDFLRAWLTSVEQRAADLSSEGKGVIALGRERLADRLEFSQFSEAAFAWFEQLKSSAPPGAGFDEYEEERTVWSELVLEITAKQGGESPSLNALLQELDLASKTPTAPRDAVRLYTIHASKGLEFAHVYLIGLVEDHLPSWAAVKKGPTSHEVQEERRNCFVALTRTQESLTISYSGRMYGYPKQPSRFLSEMGLLA